MPRAKYPGASDRELFRAASISRPKATGARLELILLAAVLMIAATQLIW